MKRRQVRKSLQPKVLIQMCSKNHIHSIENGNLFNVFGVVAQIEKLDRENSNPQTTMQQALAHNDLAQEKIQ